MTINLPAKPLQEIRVFLDDGTGIHDAIHRIAAAASGHRSAGIDERE